MYYIYAKNSNVILYLDSCSTLTDAKEAANDYWLVVGNPNLEYPLNTYNCRIIISKSPPRITNVC
jgi:hypothetical protein